MKLPTQSEYPKELKIGPDIWKLKFVKRMPKGGKGCSGLCVIPDKTIYIKSTLTLSECMGTFIHEVLHCMEEYDGLYLEHSAVYKLEKAISDFVLSNF